jgi:hypothetical protein
VAFAADASRVDILVTEGAERCAGAMEQVYGIPPNSTYAKATFLLLHVDADGAVTVRE